MSKTYTKIQSVEDLKAKCTNSFEDFYIFLNKGVYSRKEISYSPDDDSFFIINCIDGTTQELTSQELFDESLTNIGKAINLNSFSHVSYD